MKVNKISFLTLMIFLFSTNFIIAQPKIKLVSGMVILDDGTLTPKEKKYAAAIDSLDRRLKISPNDTAALFYRAMLYNRLNSIQANPDLSTNNATSQLLIGWRMAERADSLKMKSLYLKVLRAQLCRELTFRFAPVETWRFNEKQLAERKKLYDRYKDLGNRYYDELAVRDETNAYDYQKLKVK